MIRNATPAAKLTRLRNDISTTKPVRLSERCGVSSAENRIGSAASGSKPLPAVMTYQYIPFMAKIIRAQRTKTTSVPKKAAKPKAKPVASKSTARAAKKSKVPKSKAPKPWTPAEVREAFERFAKANPEPRG